MAEDPELFKSREPFLRRATEKLGLYPSNFLSAMEQIRASVRTVTPHQAAGVLVPLYFRISPSDPRSEGQFVFQLIKRSSRVSQPGDLSCPGGMVHPILDRLLRPLLFYGFFSIVRGPARHIWIAAGTSHPENHVPFSCECPARSLGRDRTCTLPRPVPWPNSHV